jgi:hypothetical protein
MDIKDYVKNIFKSMTLIVRRNTENREYEIISDYDSVANTNYVLIIEPESNPHLKYLVVHMATFKPLLINDYKQFKEFIKHAYKASSRNLDIMKYLNIVLKLKIDDSLSVYQFVNDVIKKGYKLIIKNDMIVGFIRTSDNVIYLTPKISYPYKQQGLFYTNDYMIKTIHSSGVKYPKLEDILNSNLIKSFMNKNEIQFCLDPLINKITGIFWNYTTDDNSLMLIEHINIEDIEKILNIPMNIIKKMIKIYDTSNYIELLLLDEFLIDRVKLKNKLGQESILKKIMIRMLKRFIEVSKDDDLELPEDKLKNKFIDFCKQFGILVKGETELVKKTSLMYDLYNTKINSDEFEKWLNDSKITFDENLDNILYDDVLYNLKMNCDDDEIITTKQFI